MADNTTSTKDVLVNKEGLQKYHDGLKKDFIDPINNNVLDLKLRTHVGEKLDYLFARCPNRSTNNVLANDLVPWTILLNNNNLEYTDGIITLKANKTYKIEAIIYGTRNFQIIDCDTQQPLESSSYGDESQMCAKSIIKTTKEMKIGIKFDLSTGSITYGWFSSLTIQEIGREVLINEVEEVAKAKHIEDTPVGSILGVLSLTAPAHYLICDGAEYNIEDYPKLAQYFKDTLGSINYYGGDGINTFTVPDMRGEFIRGYDATNIKDPLGSQRGIGKHEDATEIPYVFSAENYIEMFKNSEGENIPKNYDISKNNNGNNLNIRSTEDSRYQGIYAYTSRPTNINVLWCIKYEPTYFMNYSPMYGGFNETVLFEGEASAIGEYTLNDDIKDYNYVKILINPHLNVWREATEETINIQSFSSTRDFMTNFGNDRRWIVYTMEKNIMKITNMSLGGYDKIAIKKIIGIKANSNTVTTDGEIEIDPIVYSDDEIKAALDNITGGDN